MVGNGLHCAWGGIDWGEVLKTQRNILGYQFAGASVLLVTIAQLALKWGITRLPGFDQRWLDFSTWTIAIYPITLLALGVIFYLCSMFFWLQALDCLPLNKAYPILSLSYAFVFIASISLPGFDETFTITQIIGVLLVSLGVWLVTSSNRLDLQDS